MTPTTRRARLVRARRAAVERLDAARGRTVQRLSSVPAATIDPRTRGPGLATTLRRLAGAFAPGAARSRDAEYRAWLALRTPSAAELAAQRSRADAVPWRPRFDVVVRRRPGDGLALE